MSQEKQSTDATKNTEDDIKTESTDTVSDVVVESTDGDSNSEQQEKDTGQSVEPAADDLQVLLDAATKKADDNWDQMLRTKAEMENLRRRSRLDVENAHKFAVEKFVTDIIPVIDSLELGLSAVGKDDHEQLEKLHEGTEMTLKMFHDVLNKFDIEVINPVNEKFNPELHQAMVMQESEEVAPNTVLMVMQKGYTLNDRLVRPAMVSVAKVKTAESAQSETGTEPEPTKKIDEKA